MLLVSDHVLYIGATKVSSSKMPKMMINGFNQLMG